MNNNKQLNEKIDQLRSPDILWPRIKIRKIKHLHAAVVVLILFSAVDQKVSIVNIKLPVSFTKDLFLLSFSKLKTSSVNFKSYLKRT